MNYNNPDNQFRESFQRELDSKLNELRKDIRGFTEEFEHIHTVVGEMKRYLLSLVDSFEKQQSLNSDELLTDAEACEILKRSRTTLYKWRKSGQLPYKEVMGSIFYIRSDIMKFLD